MISVTRSSRFNTTVRIFFFGIFFMLHYAKESPKYTIINIFFIRFWKKKIVNYDYRVCGCLVH